MLRELAHVYVSIYTYVIMYVSMYANRGSTTMIFRAGEWLNLQLEPNPQEPVRM